MRRVNPFCEEVSCVWLNIDMSKMWCTLALVCAAAVGARAHGRVLAPASRASAWRAGHPVPPDYDDDGANCGGFSVQHSTNKGKCGICGDAYNLSPPRPHELGGTYGIGVITGRYQPGDILTATVDLTTSHKGFWEFKLCPDPTNNEQECFDRFPLELEDGGTRYYPDRGSTKYNVNYKLPAKMACEHCVLQWRYTAGNNWGVCGNGTSGLGCGPQEQFGACSDISISAGSSRTSLTDGAATYSKFAPKDVASTASKTSPKDGAGEAPLLYYFKNGYFDAEKGILHLLRGSVRPNTNQRTPPPTQNPAQQEQRPQTKLNNQLNGPTKRPEGSDQSNQAISYTTQHNKPVKNNQPNQISTQNNPGKPKVYTSTNTQLFVQPLQNWQLTNTKTHPQYPGHTKQHSESVQKGQYNRNQIPANQRPVSPQNFKQIQQLQQLQHIQHLIQTGQQIPQKKQKHNANAQTPEQNQKLIEQSQQHYYNKNYQNEYFQNTNRHRRPRTRNKPWKTGKHKKKHKGKRKRKKKTPPYTTTKSFGEYHHKVIKVGTW